MRHRLTDWYIALLCRLLGQGLIDALEDTYACGYRCGYAEGQAAEHAAVIQEFARLERDTPPRLH
jgi:hypothetical protein